MTKPAHMAAKIKCEATWLSKPRKATYTGAMVMKPPTKKPAVMLPNKAKGTTSHNLGKLMPIFCGNCGCSMRVNMMGMMDAAANIAHNTYMVALSIGVAITKDANIKAM